MKRIKQDYDELVEKNRLRPKWKKVMTELQDYCLAKGIIVRKRRKVQKVDET